MRFDDIEIGTPITVGSHSFTREAILDFARQFDPQPFHTDEAAAEASVFGGLIASGWHTASAWMRLTVDYAREHGGLAGISPGQEELLWTAPVRPGDTVTYRNTGISKRRLASRPGWALITYEVDGFNQAGVEVFRMRGPVLAQIED